VATAGKIYVLNPQYQSVRTISDPPPAGRYGMLTWYELGGSEALVTTTEVSRSGHSIVTVYRIAPDGSIRSKQILDLEQPTNWARQNVELLGLGFALPAPAVYSSVMLTTILLMRVENEDRPTAMQALLMDSLPSIIAVIILGLLLAAWTHQNAKQFALPAKEGIAWTLFVFLFGLPGLAGYLLHRRWPVREKCPHCQKSFPRTGRSAPRAGRSSPTRPSRERDRRLIAR